jgi:hypothetical protein
MARTIVKKRDLQKLISESIQKGKRRTKSPSIDFNSLNENINKTHNRIRIAIVKEGIRGLDIIKYKPILSESFYGTGSNRHHPGESAAAGLEEIIKGLKKAYDMVTDKNTSKMIMNSIVRLGNTLSVIGTYAGAAQRQSGVDDNWLYGELKDIPYPEVEAAEEGDEKAAERIQKSFLTGME